MDRVAMAAALLALPFPLFCSMAHLPTPGIPRTADGNRT